MSLCLSPVHSPFEAITPNQVESLETRDIGMLGYLAGSHKRMLKNAQARMTTNSVPDGTCSKSSSVVIYMEPAEYSAEPCSQDGSVIHKGAQIKIPGKTFKMKTASKMAADWITDTMSADYVECPSTCSFASTTRIQIEGRDLYVESAMKCVTKRENLVNRVHTALLHEWTCNH